MPMGRNQRQLTRPHAYIVGYPRWSPDGKQNVFHARLPEVPQIYVVDAEGECPEESPAPRRASYADLGDGRQASARQQQGGR